MRPLFSVNSSSYPNLLLRLLRKSSSTAWSLCDTFKSSTWNWTVIYSPVTSCWMYTYHIHSGRSRDRSNAWIVCCKIIWSLQVMFHILPWWVDRIRIPSYRLCSIWFFIIWLIYFTNHLHHDSFKHYVSRVLVLQPITL